MKAILNKLLGRSAPKNDFSTFFSDASSREKKELFKKVIRKANEDQKALFDRSRNTSSVKTA